MLAEGIGDDGEPVSGTNPSQDVPFFSARVGLFLFLLSLREGGEWRFPPPPRGSIVKHPGLLHSAVSDP